MSGQSAISVAFVVNGSKESAMGVRASGLASGLSPRWQPHFLYRQSGSKLRAAARFFWALLRLRPRVLYVLDMGVSGVLAALPFLCFGRAVIIDTGDAITALARSAKLRGGAGLAATWLLEECSLRTASHIVVRGFRHQQLLEARRINCTWIPDGFEPEYFYPPRTSPTPIPSLTIGLIGSVIWNGRLSTTYGWDLIEILAALNDLPVQGILIGDGDGLARLRDHAQTRGVIDRIRFVGRIPYKELRPWLHSFDIALSTQTNDLPGQVRTTGKLPLYLACGCFLIASRVGEAARVLPEEMLVDYHSAHDPGYPGRAAAHVRKLIQAGTSFRERGLETSARLSAGYEYSVLSRRLEALLTSLAPKGSLVDA